MTQAEKLLCRAVRRTCENLLCDVACGRAFSDFKKIIFLNSHFLTEESSFELEREPVPDLPTSTNFIFRISHDVIINN